MSRWSSETSRCVCADGTFAITSRVCVCVSLCVTVCAQLSKRVALLQEDLNSPVKNKKRKVVKALSVHCHTALCVCVCVCVCTL